MTLSAAVSGILLSLPFLLCALSFASDAGQPPPASPYFRITVTDEQTGRGVPLIDLRTVSNIRCVTDSRGVIAFHEPGLMDREVFFFVTGHGYEHAADGFGYRGLRLRVTPGGSASVKVKRLNIAERLYRITGEGIYRDSILLGDKVPIQQPVLNGQVSGQDSALALPYRGKIYWFWGDTGRPSYPLGNFAMSGATSEMPGSSGGGLDPAVGIDLTYFVDSGGFSRPMAPLPDPGVVWLDGIVTVKDANGQERMVAHYERLKGLGESLARGLMVFDDTRQTFKEVKRLDLQNPFHPQGMSPIRRTEGGTEYLIFPHPFPNLRVPATWEAVQDPARYEAFTPLAPGSRYAGADSRLDRDGAGKLRWAWKRDTEPLDPAQQQTLIDAGKIKSEECPFRLEDIDTGKPVQAHRGSVCWNEYRKRWVMIFTQMGGSSSLLGEIWYAEAPAPEGPWQAAKKIVTHDKYTFYNPVQHPFFDEQGGRFIFFEGTYTNQFSGNDYPTPRYDYNQIMYRLDLSDERLRRKEPPTQQKAAP